jgi:hypothetical protein
MLKERIEQATSVIREYTDLLKKDNEVKQFETMVVRLGELKPPAQKTAQSFHVLFGHFPENFKKFPPQAVRDLRQIRNDLQLGSFPDLQKVRNIKETLSEQEKQLQGEWKHYVNFVSCSMENTLGILRPLLDNPLKVIEITTKLNYFRGQWPVEERHLVGLDEVIAGGSKIISNLSLDGEIENFLVKVIQQEARLTDLNQKIIDWLNDKKMSKYLVISIERE